MTLTKCDKQIIDILKQRDGQTIIIADLANDFGVSRQFVSKRLNLLIDNGFVSRTGIKRYHVEEAPVNGQDDRH